MWNLEDSGALGKRDDYGLVPWLSFATNAFSIITLVITTSSSSCLIRRRVTIMLHVEPASISGKDILAFLELWGF